MDVNKILENLKNENTPIDIANYATNLLSYHIINHNYLRAILEAQVEILVRLNDNSDIDVDGHLKIIEDKIDKESDKDFIEAMQQIIRKD
ncbi:hypothetical protein [Autumnicola musiva]|uniref:Uncharacterized protein n=1 Tax=Autumnicola musiva TaxID=3075589 RepID=A0ABU3DAC2_9FLAO|nr:hypothetical protein [Zunongwangia sp. F117]MDT0678304.1 hypothetical protein [Zunongwangia sp. F117]